MIIYYCDVLYDMMRVFHSLYPMLYVSTLSNIDVPSYT